MAALNKKKQKLPSTQQFVPIKEIRDGVMVMKEGSLRAVLLVSSVNFALKSEDEKNAIVSSYQSFLNSLEFPIQIYVKSRQLHLDAYIGSLQKQLELQTNELLKLQTSQYIDFVTELLQASNVMEKQFFLIVPFYPTGVEKVGLIKGLISGKKGVADTDFETQRVELMARVDRIISGLTGIGVRCAALKTEELIELYYAVYNPDISGNEKLTNVAEVEAPIVSSEEKPEEKPNA
jgi:hypothetical protein